MSEKINEGGPAFPIPEWSDAHGTIMPAQYGMSLRDYFASQALAAHADLITVSAVEEDIRAQMLFIAKIAYAQADAMLKARGE